MVAMNVIRTAFQAVSWSILLSVYWGIQGLVWGIQRLGWLELLILCTAIALMTVVWVVA